MPEQRIAAFEVMVSPPPGHHGRRRLALVVSLAAFLFAGGCAEANGPLVAPGVPAPPPPSFPPPAPPPPPPPPPVPPPPPLPPPSPPQIVWQPGPAGIYLVAPDGSGMRFLVAGERPTWSPDGGRIAFQRGGRVRVINADGTGEVSLGLGVEPAWAPDGERLAFTGPDGIQVMRDDGTEVSTLVPNGFRADSWTPDYIGVSKPRWSPDGTQLAFVHQGAGEFDAAEIFVVQNRGGAPRRVTSYAGLHYPEADPVWTPDGSELVFFSSAEGVAAVSAAGGTPVPLYKNWPIVAYGARPVVAPDGRVCFTAVWGTVSAWSIWCIDRQDGSLQVLLDGALHAVWSPDGGAIAFEAHMPLGSQ